MKKQPFASLVYSAMFVAAVALVFAANGHAEQSGQCGVASTQAKSAEQVSGSGCCPFVAAQRQTEARKCGEGGEEDKAACPAVKTQQPEASSGKDCAGEEERTTTASRMSSEQSGASTPTFSWPFRAS